MQIRRSAIVAVICLVSILLLTLFRVVPAHDLKFPTTQIPFYFKGYVKSEGAIHIINLAEFSIKLMQWSDTDRQSVLKVMQKAKMDALDQRFYRLLNDVVKSVSEAYWSLQSPHLANIT